MHLVNSSKIRILLGDGRGKTELNGLCSHHALNFGGHKTAGREPFGELAALNLDTLAPECSTNIDVASPMEICLIPIAGGLELSLAENEKNVYVNAGETARISIQPGTSLKITNPYPTQNVSFCQIWIQPGPIAPPKGGHYLINGFDIDSRNTILPLFTSLSEKTAVSIAKYDLRAKGIFACGEVFSDLFVYVIHGAFEFQDRLIQQNDGLRFEDLDYDVEFEALSQDAIILMISQ